MTLTESTGIELTEQNTNVQLDQGDIKHVKDVDMVNSVQSVRRELQDMWEIERTVMLQFGKADCSLGKNLLDSETFRMWKSSLLKNNRIRTSIQDHHEC